MADRKIVVPDAMRRAFGRGTQDVDPEGYLAFHGLEQVILWLTDILHERNPDFHRAILKREKERIPGDDNDTAIIARRVDFEYGVSFARNYIRGMFVAQEPEVPEEIKDLMVFENCLDTSISSKTHNEYMLKAFHRGQESKKPKVIEQAKLCRHCGKNVAGGFFDAGLCGPCYNTRSEWELKEALTTTEDVLMGALNQQPYSEYLERIKKNVTETFSGMRKTLKSKDSK